MGNPLGETFKIDGADAAVLARNVKAHAGEVKAVLVGGAGPALTNAFPGFQVGQAYESVSPVVRSAVDDIAGIFDSLAANTVAVSAIFLQVDEDRAREYDRVDSGR